MFALHVIKIEKKDIRRRHPLGASQLIKSILIYLQCATWHKKKKGRVLGNWHNH